MLTQSLNTSISLTKAAPAPFAKPDQFRGLTGHAGPLVASEFSYRKDEEIYGEDERAEYVYQVIRGAVRTYKAAFRRPPSDRRISCQATSSDSNRAPAIASPQKLSSTRQ